MNIVYRIKSAFAYFPALEDRLDSLAAQFVEVARRHRNIFDCIERIEMRLVALEARPIREVEIGDLLSRVKALETGSCVGLEAWQKTIGRFDGAMDKIEAVLDGTDVVKLGERISALEGRAETNRKAWIDVANLFVRVAKIEAALKGRPFYEEAVPAPSSAASKADRKDVDLSNEHSKPVAERPEGVKIHKVEISVSSTQHPGEVARTVGACLAHESRFRTPPPSDEAPPRGARSGLRDGSTSIRLSSLGNEESKMTDPHVHELPFGADPGETNYLSGREIREKASLVVMRAISRNAQPDEEALVRCDADVLHAYRHWKRPRAYLLFDGSPLSERLTEKYPTEMSGLEYWTRTNGCPDLPFGVPVPVETGISTITPSRA